MNERTEVDTAALQSLVDAYGRYQAADALADDAIGHLQTALPGDDDTEWLQALSHKEDREEEMWQAVKAFVSVVIAQEKA